MNSFLYRVAEKYYNTFQAQIANFTFVFPNRRAGLFFRMHLSQLTDKALFSPEIITINDCFSSASSLQAADKLNNLFLIYRIYKKISGTDESFDSFVFWGEMLLNDFDEVDKYLVNASQIFRNITELKELEQLFNVLTDKQLEVIQQFWKNFLPVSEEKTKEEFITTWKVLAEVYSEFVTQLKSQGLGTEGMICREVIENLKNGNEIQTWESKQFVFVGFNALNPCEKALMYELQQRSKADFYWDYESAMLRDTDNPASLFFAENTTVFPSKYYIQPIDEPFEHKTIKLVGIPSAVGMTKYVYSTLDKLSGGDKLSLGWMNTAVILPDETLLLPMLYAFPASIDKINITMGYPLSSTPVSGLITQLFDLQSRIRSNDSRTLFYHKNVSDLLNHQYISQLFATDCDEILQEMIRFNMIFVDAKLLKKNALFNAIFSPVNSVPEFLNYLLSVLRFLSLGWKNAANELNDYQLERDFLQQYYMTINRMSAIIGQNSDEAGMKPETLGKLIQQVSAGINIPFVGEPLDGLQVMGVLESRGLDFENLIITSFNEGVFPKKTSQNSFIPYNLRKGFGLPTFEIHDAITSYNFYRLIHRAKQIHFVYDARTEGVQSGEVSRFIHQLNYHYGLNIEVESVNYDISFGETKPIIVKKTPEVLSKLSRFLSDDENRKYLSASSIKSYIDCPLQFYLTRIERLDESDEVKETIEDSMFGTLFHAIMEFVYKPMSGRVITTELIDSVIKNQLLIDKYINKAFAVEFFKKKNDEIVELEGNNLLIASVLRKYVIKVLQYDKSYAPFVLLESERKCDIKVKTQFGDVNIMGIIDRVDEKDGKVRVLDYKTGGGNLEFNSWEEVFEHNNDKRPKYILQTFLYGLLYKNEVPGKSIAQGIIYLREIFKDTFRVGIYHKPTKSDVDNFDDFELEFVANLTACLEEIFEPEIDFVQSESHKPCEYCLYKGICNR